MQTSTALSPELISEHLSPVAAKMILAALPERIQRALIAHSVETEYPIEMVIEMAISGFLDSECINFSDCQSEYM